MNVHTGQVYETYSTAIDAGENPDDIVEINGTQEQVAIISEAIRAKRRAKNKRARASRKRNRK